MYPSEQLESRSLSIYNLLKENYFIIPPNQREYKWATSELQKLWDDILLCIKTDLKKSSLRKLGHFMGAVVVTGSRGPGASTRLNIIDGQQRITTFVILAAAIKDVLSETIERGENQLDEYDRPFSDMIAGSEIPPEPRIKLNRENAFFEEYFVTERKRSGRNEIKKSLERKGINKVQKTIIDSYEFFYNNLQNYLSNEKISSPKEFFFNFYEVYNKLFYCLFIRADDNDIAYRFFETLNERGLDLTQADLIRNVLVEVSSSKGDEESREVIQKWSETIANIEDNFPRPKLTVPFFIQFSYSSRYQTVKAEQLFDHLSRKLRTDELDSNTLVNHFKEDSESWLYFVAGDLNQWDEDLIDIRYAILNPLWKKHSVPFILACVQKFAKPKDMEYFKTILKLLESYLMRVGIVSGQDISTLQKVLAKCARIIRSDRRADNVIEQIRTLLRDESPDKKFIEELSVFSCRTNAQAFYIAWKLEIAAERDHGRSRASGKNFRPAKQNPSQHLEHIMPRKPGAGWRSDLSADEDFLTHIMKVGNLLVLEGGINKSIKNDSLSCKISNSRNKDYRHSQLALPRQIEERSQEWLDADEWTFESINRRQRFLVEEYALKAWGL